MTIRLHTWLLMGATVAWLAMPAAHAQTLRLVAPGTGPGVGPDVGHAGVSLRVGERLTVHLQADLASLPVAGIAAYLTVPEDAFAVVDQGHPGQPGVQPFRFGPLFESAQVPVNALVEDAVAAVFPGQQLDLAAVFGLGSTQRAEGSGTVATFELTALQPIADAEISIDVNPVRETKLLANDGAERRFQAVTGLAVSVAGAGPEATQADPGGWARVKLATAAP
jgi:hypothetical protein